jgi:hypothetical protein
MAIVQISQITNRKGLSTDLPQLAGAELGWSTDTRQLWIGNGTLEDGAPVIDNTEILTEFSNISALFSTTQSQFSQGTYTRLIGKSVTLLNDVGTTEIDTFDTTLAPTFSFDYSIERNGTFRNAIIRVASAGSASLAFDDSGVQNASTGVTISITQSLGIVRISYSTNDTGFNGTLSYSIFYLA